MRGSTGRTAASRRSSGSDTTGSGRCRVPTGSHSWAASRRSAWCCRGSPVREVCRSGRTSGSARPSRPGRAARPRSGRSSGSRPGHVLPGRQSRCPGCWDCRSTRRSRLRHRRRRPVEPANVAGPVLAQRDLVDLELVPRHASVHGLPGAVAGGDVDWDRDREERAGAALARVAEARDPAADRGGLRRGRERVDPDDAGDVRAHVLPAPTTRTPAGGPTTQFGQSGVVAVASRDAQADAGRPGKVLRAIAVQRLGARRGQRASRTCRCSTHRRG